ncbi:MAG: hypothetical protein DWI06_01930 [Planctomycetota bacterium]|jgi:hypothetical protein|nr:MAG: hypothetical protein DWI06_01930 [Planctomycetota bacterium]
MALNIGKKMVYLLALSSFTLATWGIALFSNPVLTPVIGADGKPKDGSWQEIDQRKAKMEAWFKDAKDGSPSPIGIAVNRYQSGREKMQKLESQVVATEKYYFDELEYLKNKASEKEPAKNITLKNGQPVRLTAKYVPLQFEELKDIDGNTFENLNALGKKIDDLDNEIRAMQKVLDDTSKENKKLVDIQADHLQKDADGKTVLGPDGKPIILVKGLQTKIEEEKAKRQRFAEEFDAIEQAYVNLTLEHFDLTKRRSELDIRFTELRNRGLVTLP